MPATVSAVLPVVSPCGLPCPVLPTPASGRHSLHTCCPRTLPCCFLLPLGRRSACASVLKDVATQCLHHASPLNACWDVSVIYSLQPASPPPASLPPLPSTQLCWVVCLLGESVTFHIVYSMWSEFNLSFWCVFYALGAKTRPARRQLCFTECYSSSHWLCLVSSVLIGSRLAAILSVSPR